MKEMTGAEGLEHIAARIGDASVSGVGTDMNKDSETVKLNSHILNDGNITAVAAAAKQTVQNVPQTF